MNYGEKNGATHRTPNSLRPLNALHVLKRIWTNPSLNSKFQPFTRFQPFSRCNIHVENVNKIGVTTSSNFVAGFDRSKILSIGL